VLRLLIHVHCADCVLQHLKCDRDSRLCQIGLYIETQVGKEIRCLRPRFEKENAVPNARLAVPCMPPN
jgi:hypothetical protein